VAQPLSRAELVLLAQYVWVACEVLSGTTTIPSADSFIAVLEALLAVRSLRTDRGGGPDRFYLGNLAGTCAIHLRRRRLSLPVATCMLPSVTRC